MHWNVHRIWYPKNACKIPLRIWICSTKFFVVCHFHNCNLMLWYSNAKQCWKNDECVMCVHYKQHADMYILFPHIVICDVCDSLSSSMHVRMEQRMKRELSKNKCVFTYKYIMKAQIFTHTRIMWNTKRIWTKLFTIFIHCISESMINCKQMNWLFRDDVWLDTEYGLSTNYLVTSI